MLKRLYNFLFGIKEAPKRESIYRDYRPPLQKLAEKEGVRYPNLDPNHLFIRNQRFLDEKEQVNEYADERVMQEYGKLASMVKEIQERRRKDVEKLIAKRVYNASPGHSFHGHSSPNNVDNSSSVLQAAVLYSVLSDSSESSTSRVDSHSSDCTSISHDTYASSSSDSYSSCDSSSSYSGRCD